MRVPAADELFRPTAVPDPPPEPAAHAEPATPAGTPSGRVKHDEKVTVYVTSEELWEIEHARLTLRRHGVAVDRGRLIRQAVAMALVDLAEHGEDSALSRRLSRA